MKWVINDKEFYSEEEAARYIIDNLDDEVFDDMLDECYEEVNVCGYTYSPSHVLYEVDPIAYRCAQDDYYDSLASDLEWELERMDDGETEDFYGFDVECVDDEEEDEDEGDEDAEV